VHFARIRHTGMLRCELMRRTDAGKPEPQVQQMSHSDTVH
jgi:hypothetical protein